MEFAEPLHGNSETVLRCSSCLSGLSTHWSWPQQFNIQVWLWQWHDCVQAGEGAPCICHSWRDAVLHKGALPAQLRLLQPARSAAHQPAQAHPCHRCARLNPALISGAKAAGSRIYKWAERIPWADSVATSAPYACYAYLLCMLGNMANTMQSRIVRIQIRCCLIRLSLMLGSSLMFSVPTSKISNDVTSAGYCERHC